MTYRTLILPLFWSMTCFATPYQPVGHSQPLNLMGKPETVGRTSFRYGPRASRYLRVNPDGSKTIYIGETEVRLSPTAAPKTKHHIRAGGYTPIATVEEGTHRYHVNGALGSTRLTISETHKVKRAHHYDPYGYSSSRHFNRGFTGHEHVDERYVHANGRVYDTYTGLFTSPDRVLSLKNGITALNRYDYIGNSPLNGTDPSGWAVRVALATLKADPVWVEYLYDMTQYMLDQSDHFKLIYNRVHNHYRDVFVEPSKDGVSSFAKEKDGRLVIKLSLEHEIRLPDNSFIKPQVTWGHELGHADEYLNLRHEKFTHDDIIATRIDSFVGNFVLNPQKAAILESFPVGYSMDVTFNNAIGLNQREILYLKHLVENRNTRKNERPMFHEERLGGKHHRQTYRAVAEDAFGEARIRRPMDVFRKERKAARAAKILEGMRK